MTSKYRGNKIALSEHYIIETVTCNKKMICTPKPDSEYNTQFLYGIGSPSPSLLETFRNQSHVTTNRFDKKKKMLIILHALSSTYLLSCNLFCYIKCILFVYWINVIPGFNVILLLKQG